jgi:hypothetical protein
LLGDGVATGDFVEILAPAYPLAARPTTLKCRSCRTPRYSPAVNMIRLTNEREIDPYLWEHPNDERWRPPVRPRVF